MRTMPRDPMRPGWNLASTRSRPAPRGRRHAARVLGRSSGTHGQDRGRSRRVRARFPFNTRSAILSNVTERSVERQVQQRVLDQLRHRRVNPVLAARHASRVQTEAHRLDHRLDQRRGLRADDVRAEQLAGRRAVSAGLSSGVAVARSTRGSALLRMGWCPCRYGACTQATGSSLSRWTASRAGSAISVKPRRSWAVGLSGQRGNSTAAVTCAPASSPMVRE
jgi:hypothetical protein